MTLDEMLMALEFGPMDYGPDDDYVLVPVQTANKIAATIRRLERLEKAGQAMRDAIEMSDIVLFILQCKPLWVVFWVFVFFVALVGLARSPL